MCGIAGYKTQRPVDPDVLPRMVRRLAHRGPDADGFFQSQGYSAGMRRLSINDPESGGQPLFNGDQTVVLFYNGEIYNYPQLRKELEARGYRFRTRCDGEVICHLYEEAADHTFEHLDGMFAAALWSVKEQKLILARDIPGEKPLYYARLPEGGVAFASELKSLRLFPGLDLTLNQQALWDFPTFLWIPEPETVYIGVRALPRGSVLIADGEGIRERPYRNLHRRGGEGLRKVDAVTETRSVVSEAVRSRLLSDVPVGSFLSSGLDSSIVATLAAGELEGMKTFSVAFEDLSDPYHGRADESEEAARQAERIGSDHHVVRATAATFRRDLDLFCHHGDQPFAVSSGLGILAVARAAREAGVKVLLSGDGADECFGGYSWYSHLNLPPGPGSSDDWEETSFSFQNFGVDLSRRLEVLSRYSAQQRAWAWHYYAHEREKRSLFAEGYGAGLESSLRFFHRFQSRANWTPEEYIAQDRDFYFPNEMLRKVDRMTMAFSVEGRVPFAAPAVLAHAGKLKYNQMVRGEVQKWVLRQAFADLLPQEVLLRPKHGFNVPIDHWLKDEWSDLFEEAFAEGSSLRRAGVIGPQSRREAATMLHDPKRLNGHTIFCFIMLNHWLEREYFGDYR